MGNKRTIKIDKRIPKSILIGLLLGWLTVFIAEHYGEISYIADTSELIAKEKRTKQEQEQKYNQLLEKKISGKPLSILEEAQFKTLKNWQNEPKNFAFNVEIPNDTPVSSIFLDTPFGSKIRINGQGYLVSDVSSSYGRFHEYSNKLGHHINASFMDFKYVILFTVGYATMLILFFFIRIDFK